MFELEHFVHKWRNTTEIESQLIRNGEEIATAIVNVTEGTLTLVSGGFSSIPENPLLSGKSTKTHAEHWSNVLKEHATDWATRNPT